LAGTVSNASSKTPPFGAPWVHDAGDDIADFVAQLARGQQIAKVGRRPPTTPK